MNKIIALYKKYKELINYGIFGLISTLINVLSFILFNNLLKIDYQISNIVAWIICIAFVFITNRKYVFKGNKGIKWEIGSFIICRLFTLMIESMILFIFIKKLLFNSIITKLIANFVVILTNYILSKLVIFKNNN